MTAMFDDGVLRITIPKMPAKAPDVVSVPIANRSQEGANKRMKTK